ncbi:MAG: hypothetical protein KatS3mg005_2559 [Bryobacteraceae bacterium]|nr:MAG: hypothetical protein KatS3mg005_2559 [Bryobacteraceae bacterium]
MLDHVAYEYVMLNAAAVEMTKPHLPPVNHLVQVAFLVHARCILDFFLLGIDGPRKDDITIRDFCIEKVETPGVEEKAKRLRKAIDKTVAHLTKSRKVDGNNPEIAPFRGPQHLHGTVTFVHEHWEKFLSALAPQLRECVGHRVNELAGEMNVNIRDVAAKLERAASHPDWTKNTLP